MKRDFSPFQYHLEYRKKVRLLKVKMLDGALKSLMVDDSQTVGAMMALICTKIGITNYDEYSLVREKDEKEQENNANTNTSTSSKHQTLGRGTLTMRRTFKDGEKEIDPKMEELKMILKTEDGGMF